MPGRRLIRTNPGKALDFCAKTKLYALCLQQGLFSDMRTGDARFQGAMVGLPLLSGFGLAFQLFNVLALLSQSHVYRQHCSFSICR